MTLKQRPLRWTDLPIDRRRRLVVLISTLIRQRLSADREACHEHGGEAFDARSGAGEDPGPPLRSPRGTVSPATLTVIVLLVSPAAKLTVPDGKTAPAKSDPAAGLAPLPVTAQLALVAILVLPSRVTVKVKAVLPD